MKDQEISHELWRKSRRGRLERRAEKMRARGAKERKERARRGYLAGLGRKHDNAG
jgi:hypothetical protein